MDAVSDPTLTAPSYSEDPRKWEAYVRREMKARLKERENITDANAEQYIIYSTFRIAKQRGVMGSYVEAWDIFAERVAAYRADKASILEPSERIRAYAAKAGRNEVEINKILSLAAPHGYKNTSFYYLYIDKQQDIELNGPAAPKPAPRPTPAPVKPVLDVENDYYWWLDTDYPPFDFQTYEPDLDTLLCRSRPSRPAPHEWSALHIKSPAAAARSAYTHFRTDLIIIDVKADVNAAIKKLLGTDIQTHIEKYGVDLTVQKLQDGLNTYGEEPKPMSQPTESQQTTPDSPAQAYLKTWTTMADVPLGDIVKELTKPWPSGSLFDIPGNQRAPKGSKGVKAQVVQDRVNRIFGQENIGWRFATHPNSFVHYGEELRETVDEKTGEKKETLWFAVRLEMFIFEYCAIAPDGSKEWIPGSPLSDSHTNMTSRNAAYRGAMSSLLKQAVTRMGGLRNVTVQQGQYNQHAGQGQGQSQPAAQHEETRHDQPSGEGLSASDVKALMEFADNKKIARGEIIARLGVANWKEWKHGLDAAKKKVEAA